MIFSFAFGRRWGHNTRNRCSLEEEKKKEHTGKLQRQNPPNREKGELVKALHWGTKCA